MIRRLGETPPWSTPAHYREGRHKCSYGIWVEVEPLWDGTRVWEYREGERLTTFLDLLTRLTDHPALATKVAWLEDTFMPETRP